MPNHLVQTCQPGMENKSHLLAPARRVACSARVRTPTASVTALVASALVSVVLEQVSRTAWGFAKEPAMAQVWVAQLATLCGAAVPAAVLSQPRLRGRGASHARAQNRMRDPQARPLPCASKLGPAATAHAYAGSL